VTTGITGQKTSKLRTDEKYDATWHHWAGKGLEPVIHSSLRRNNIFPTSYFVATMIWSKTNAFNTKDIVLDCELTVNKYVVKIRSLEHNEIYKTQ
jgi:hypothetical protein